MYLILLIIANLVSIIFTIIGLKWMYKNFVDQYAVRKQVSKDLESVLAAKTIAIFYIAGSIALTSASIFVAIYYN